MAKRKTAAPVTWPEPAAHLSERAAALWRELVPRRARSPERLALLQAALEALDRADAARVALDGQPLTTTTRTSGAVHVHPLVRVERESRAAFARLWRDLALTYWVPIDGGRPA